MNLKLKIPFFNREQKTYSECVEDIRESDSFYMETGHSGFSEEALREPLISQQTRDIINPTKLISTDDLLEYRKYHQRQSEVLETEELLRVSKDWITNNIEKVNRDKSKDLSFPSFKESLDSEREDEALKDKRLRDVYLKKRVRREMRKEEKVALIKKKKEKKENLRYQKEAEARALENNPNKKYVEIALVIIKQANIISSNRNNYTTYNIKYKSNGKHFILSFIPQYTQYHYDEEDYDIGYMEMSNNRMRSGIPSHREEVYKGRISINEIETEHCGLPLANYELLESQSNMLSKAIKKRFSHIKRRTLYEMFETLDMNKKKTVDKPSYKIC